MNKPQKQRVAVQLARPQSTDQHSNIPSLSRPLHPAAAQDSGDGSHQLSMVLLLYDDDENLVTALVPSLTACFASSPGSMRRTAVWISRLLKVAFLLYVDNFGNARIGVDLFQHLVNVRRIRLDALFGLGAFGSSSGGFLGGCRLGGLFGRSLGHGCCNEVGWAGGCKSTVLILWYTWEWFLLSRTDVYVCYCCTCWYKLYRQRALFRNARPIFKFRRDLSKIRLCVFLESNQKIPYSGLDRIRE
jgi:hypothetical protein